ncbi:MAG: sigma-70 family RNA polymerase sigma factor [Faecousia sp.]
MSRRKTKAENIRNPEHYFNRYIAKEVIHDTEETQAYKKRNNSFEAILLGEDPNISRKKLLSIAANEDGYLLKTHEYKSVDDWLKDIENEDLFYALNKLKYRQQLILLYRYDYLLSQREVAELLHISQQAVSKLEQAAKKKIKKFLLKGCEKP